MFDVVAPDAQTRQAVELMLRQAFMSLVIKNGGSLTIPVAEVDATGGHLMSVEVDQHNREFTFKTTKKQ